MKHTLLYHRTPVAAGVFLLLVFAWGSVTALLAQSPPLSFSRMTVEDGLSQNNVQTILQDRDGFMWFGTDHGLNKYDGYNFTTFYHDPSNNYSLPYNDIGAMIEDRAGNLWLLANNALCRLNREDKSKGKFIRYDLTATALCEDDSGLLWLADQLHFIRFDPNQNKIVQRLTASVTYPDGGEMPYSFFKDPQGVIWTGLAGGEIIRLFQNHEGRWQLASDRHHAIGRNHLRVTPVYRVQAFYHGPEKLAWLGMHGGGVCRMRLSNNQILSCEHFLHDPANPRSLSSNFVQTLLVDKAGTLWVGTNNGLCKLVRNDNNVAEFARYQHDPADPASLSDNEVLSIYQDRSGMIWVGTNGGGVNKFDPKQLQLRHFQINAANAAGSRDNAVWTFYEDRDATLWIGGNGKLTKFKRNRNNGEGNFTPYLLPTGISPDVNIPQVRAICEEGKTLWIGTVGYGFGKFDRVNETFTFYTPDSLSQKNLNDHNIYSLYADPAGALWMAINKGASAGLAKMWRDKQLGMQYKNHFRFGNNPRGKLGWVLAIHPSRRSRELWLGTWSEGLLLFDPQQEIFTSHFNSADSNSLCHNTVISIYEDHAGIVWVGTYGGGLDKVDLATAQVTHYKTGQGLPDNVIYGILPDDFGNLWLSTNKGLSRFDPHNESFLNFDVTDGLQGKEFNLGAAFKARNGELFFGGNNGFNCFHPADVLNTTPPQIALTAFKKFGKEVVLDAPLTDLITLTLSHRDDFFAFEFAALHYKNPARNRYAYKLEGFDDDWIEIGNKREASYTSLDPGEYTFRVKAANSDGVWNQQGLAIQVKITPPYWQTWWFFLLLAGMAGGTIYWLLHSRVRRVLALERLKIQEREQLQKKIAADFHDDLGHRLTNISWAANILKQQAPALPPALLELLDKIAAHAAHLSTEKDEFVWKLDPQKDSLYHLAEQWKDFSDELFNNTDIAFQLAGLSAEFERIKLPVEWKKHLYLIFKEAMHNVLKHAAGCKNVTLAIKLQDESLQVSLTDDGHGFHPANERHGHGLRNMRQRTEFLGATIEIGANDGGGTCVCFTGKLPKRPVESMAKMPILGKLFRFIQNSVHKPRKGLHPKHAA